MRLIKHFYSFDFYCSSDKPCSKPWFSCDSCSSLCIFHFCSVDHKDVCPDDKNFLKGVIINDKT